MRAAGLLALLAIPVMLAGAVVDRIAVAVGTKVITKSEITLRIRLTAFENGTEPEFTSAARKTAAGQLIDQKLVEGEMEVGRYPAMSTAKRDGLVDDYAKQFYRSDRRALDRALEQHDLTEAELEEDLARQNDLLTFLSLRFRPAVQVSDRQVRRYFQDKVSPGGEKGSVTLEDFRSRIEEQLANDQADSDLEAWLKDQRRRMHIRYLEKDLAP